MTTAARSCPACHTPLPDEAHFCLHCGAPTPTEPGVPPRTAATGVVEVAQVRSALEDRYRVERVLGEGGMATVYLAEDLKHHRKVAVKVMRPELAATLGAERFLREVEIAAQLSHPHILPVHDSGEANGLLYYVMPWVEGESLRERLYRENQLPADEALRLAREVAEALAYAHGRGIIHRDIKPANILLSAGHALVADFGIARAVGTSGGAITKTGIAVGTPQYMAPEQATGEREVDGRADIYALGAVLYEMIAGEAPFTGPSARIILTRSMTETPRPLTASRAGLSPAVDQLVSKALAKSPADRFPSTSALVEALNRVLDAVRSGSQPVLAPEGPSRLQVWGLFTVASVFTLAVVYGLVSRWGLPKWTLGLAAALVLIGAAVLVVTGRMEQRRRTGGANGGLAGLFTWRNAALGGGLALVLWAAVAMALVLGGPGKAATEGGAVRLAVLPFDNRGAAADAYFVDGVADQVRGKLTGLGGFQVTARSSSDQYRQTTKTPKQVGQELGVDYLLSATVTWAKDAAGKGRVQVVPELIDVSTGAVKWQQSFDADVTDVFQVQSAIATQVAGALGVALGSTEQQQLAERPTGNLAAYDLYLKAKALTGSDPATLRQAIGNYEQAVALDSTFADAYARLSGSLSVYYNNAIPDPAVGTRAREAAEHALALRPNGAAGHSALATYYQSVLKSPARAQEQIILALRAAPNDPTILRVAANIETSLGRWEDGLVHLQQARRLDPRSSQAAYALARALLYLRRYPEALAASNDALALAPADLNNIELHAMGYLAQGDLDGARGVLKSVPATLAQPALVAYFATYNDLYWVLDDQQQQLLLRLTPASFFDDPSAWASVMMQTYWLRGDKARARTYADSARIAYVPQLAAAPDDPQAHVLYGLALAYLGRKTEAIAEGERGLALSPLSRDAVNGAYFQHQVARIYLLVGEPEKALDKLEPLLKLPYYLSPAWLRIDPTFAELKGNPRYDRLLKG